MLVLPPTTLPRSQPNNVHYHPIRSTLKGVFYQTTPITIFLNPKRFIEASVQDSIHGIIPFDKITQKSVSGFSSNSEKMTK